MGDTEAVLGLDGLKEEASGAGQEKVRKQNIYTADMSIISIMFIISTQVRSVSTGSSRGSAQLEVKLPWYMGITCKVGTRVI